MMVNLHYNKSISGLLFLHIINIYTSVFSIYGSLLYWRLRWKPWNLKKKMGLFNSVLWLWSGYIVSKWFHASITVQLMVGQTWFILYALLIYVCFARILRILVGGFYEFSQYCSPSNFTDIYVQYSIIKIRSQIILLQKWWFTLFDFMNSTIQIGK